MKEDTTTALTRVPLKKSREFITEYSPNEIIVKAIRVSNIIEMVPANIFDLLMKNSKKVYPNLTCYVGANNLLDEMGLKPRKIKNRVKLFWAACKGMPEELVEQVVTPEVEVEEEEPTPDMLALMFMLLNDQK